ncbi:MULTISPECIES: uroporphyrinogen-III C-methyltransferase [Planktothricoides]|uniref:uroporphyrinogen-III C-methyltransferase n=2 Tax=Planktothricoides raciborskii TaxID=132608 RepID=A0AAU8JKG1_9CYAN|nr:MULTISPECIES: uroporphyrinogen-III C-methyltransferase [Planktothricoides]KOR34523.1 porphyrin biosynthesis protein [Planktothricoides sp. SR001]
MTDKSNRKSDRMYGQVYLVGAGLGNIAYLTRRAEELLKQAEVIIYDALVDEQILQFAPANCQLFHVGKRGGQASWLQTDINRLLVSECQAGKQVVRLKGGDPFIFGRCTAEIMALQEAGCCFEVVPGISSALAAPELAAIPLTDPVLSRSFTVLTGHEPADLNWEIFSQLETLVILMGTQQLPEIIHQLLRHDRSPKTPIAIIQAGGTPKQTVWTGTLGDILETTRGLSLSPAVIAIGEVVGLRDYLCPPGSPGFLNKFAMSDQSLPLAGITILITRAAGQNNEFRDRLEEFGAIVAEMPALEIGPPSSWQELDRAIANLDSYHWLILTSTNGVDYFFDRLLTQGKDTRHLAGIKIAVVGKKTAASLKQRGLQADFIPPNFVADSLVAEFPESVAGKNILFPRVETGGREVLVAEFTAAGANVTEVAAYQSGCPKKIDPAVANLLLQRQVDVITFASSKTVQYFCQLLTQELASNQNLNQDQQTDYPQTKKDQNLDNLLSDVLSNVYFASIGPQTSQTCIKLLGRVDIEAEEYTLDGLTQTIVKWASHRDKQIN